MMLFCRQSDFFWRAIFAEHFTTNMVVLAFHFVGQSFAKVMD